MGGLVWLYKDTKYPRIQRNMKVWCSYYSLSRHAHLSLEAKSLLELFKISVHILCLFAIHKVWAIYIANKGAITTVSF